MASALGVKPLLAGSERRNSSLTPINKLLQAGARLHLTDLSLGQQARVLLMVEIAIPDPTHHAVAGKRLL